jgi:N-acetylglucosamine malate deacetylase 1
MQGKLTILAVSAHGNEMESTCPLLTKYARTGHRVIVLNLTGGEKGHPALSPEEYLALKKEEARKIAELVGISKQIFLPFPDAELPTTDDVKFMICDVIRDAQPDIVITHWRGSWHKDHRATYQNVMDGIFYAELPAIRRSKPAYGVKRLFFTDNWEEWEGFNPNVFVEIDKESFDLWARANAIPVANVGAHGGFRYLDFYKSLLQTRGVLAGCQYAQALYTPVEIHTRDIFVEYKDIEPIIPSRQHNLEMYMVDQGK